MRILISFSCLLFLCASVSAFAADFSLRDLGGGNAEISKYEGAFALTIEEPRGSDSECACQRRLSVLGKKNFTKRRQMTFKEREL